MHKQRQTAQLQQAYQTTTGDAVENWDDGKSIGKKEQARILRERNKQQQEKWTTLFRLMRYATFGMVLTWYGLLYSWKIDGGVKIVFSLVSIGLFYALGSFVLRSYCLWQKRPGRDGRYYYVGPPLFQDPPLLALTTLNTMHLVYVVTNIFDGGAVPEAIAAGDQSLFQLGMMSIIPTIFAFVAVVRALLLCSALSLSLCPLSRKLATAPPEQFCAVLLAVASSPASGQ